MSESSTSVALTVRRLLSNLLCFESVETDIDDRSPLLAYGMSSIEVIGLLADIEAEFGFEFSIDELGMENFETIATIVAIVERSIHGSA